MLIALLFGWTVSVTATFAHGALAAGVPDDVAKDGVAVKYWLQADTPEAASASAMRSCRQANTSETARAKCQIVRTFSGQCAAIALDPQDGTPGYGWGVGDDQNTAEREATVMCYATSPTERTQFCKITASGCDR